MRWKRALTALCAGGILLTTSSCSKPASQAATEKTPVTGSAADIGRASVHDPSVVRDPGSGTYYVFGSHLATAKSDDLVNWTAISTDYQNAEDNPVYGNVITNFAESFRWAGYDDGDCSGGKLAVWAPDVCWNEDYEWDDGSKGAWLLYYSASSTWRRSCIGYAAAKEVGGPYAYVGTIVYSGITEDGLPDGKSERSTRWDNDYLHFTRLIEEGVLEGVNEKWFKPAGYNTDYAPNAIDPTIVRDKDGALYMVYGSWSGGLYLLALDPKTGAPVYPGKDGENTDRYYGIHLAGGNHQSGEGPYILYDPESDYYYLYETYGGLTRTGGYNMRLFRSKEITGPYVDAMGRDARGNAADNDSYGIKLIGNYQFAGQRGYCAAGHNSALIDGDGSRYLVFHQRFDEGTEYHEVRVRQQFLSESGWPVPAVYENRNEAIARYDDAQTAGTYEFIDHGADTSGKMIPTGSVTLGADGVVSGALTGTWEKKDSKKGYDWLTITADGAVYQGFFFRQTDDNGGPVMTFSAIGDNNHSIWGSMPA